MSGGGEGGEHSLVGSMGVIAESIAVYPGHRTYTTSPPAVPAFQLTFFAQVEQESKAHSF